LQRLEKAHEEIERASQMDFVYLVNDDLDASVEALQQLIELHRSR
jgi:guanylate kinase